MTSRRLPPRTNLQHHAVFLDFDGTLTPIVASPDLVELAPPTHDLIERLLEITSGAVAVISGRGLVNLASHTGTLPVTLSGSHGLELRFPNKELSAQEGFDETLEAAAASLSDFATPEGLLLESKPGAVALHYRARPDRADAARAAVEAVARDLGLRHMHGNLVSEVVPRGIDKGTALTRIMEHSPFAGRLPVMIGDDTTDEDGFDAAQKLGGFGLRIGGTQTCAQYRVADMESALAWLDRSLRG